MMKVSELIRLLSECDPDATVTTMSQPSWPFEYSIAGVAIREDFDDSADDDGTYEPHNLDQWSDNPRSGGDVIIVEGTQLSYGNKDAWNVVSR